MVNLVIIRQRAITTRKKSKDIVYEFEGISLVFVPFFAPHF
jgi:rhamnose utilization protein RhaD (predicted bifunctional aldolase and dehydrogenase)